MTRHRVWTCTSLVGLALALICTGCSDDDLKQYAHARADTGAYSDDASVAFDGSAYAADAGMGPPSSSNPYAAGTLTAGSFDDHDHPAVFDEFVKKMTQSCPDAKVEKRVLIQVLDDGYKPLADAKVQVAANGKKLVELTAASDGRTLFLPSIDAPGKAPATLQVSVSKGSASATQTVSLTQGTVSIRLTGVTAPPPAKLDVAFVVDATGSMADEITFLKAELQDIVKQVNQRHPNAQIRFALVVYRDKGDAYVTRSFDFGSLGSFSSSLALQSAAGGGDMPEAMDSALAAAAKLSWGTGGARVLFLIADAPPHDAQMGQTLGLMDGFRKQGVRVYPIAASGAAAKAEYVMRVGAFKTLARYIFLSNDSGYGNPHADPNVPPHTPSQTTEKPCYNIEKLNGLLVRTIASEFSGAHIPATPSEVLRSVGTPVGGFCDGVPVPTTDGGGAPNTGDGGAPPNTADGGV